MARIRFYDFLNRMYDNSNEKSQERYVLNAVSALCGETNPISANKVVPFSKVLPEGLTGINSSYRKKLYSDKSKGLSGTIKQHIRECEDKKYADNEPTNKKTFISYLEKSILSEESFSGVCSAFNVSDSIDRSIVFEGIYEQFMAFVCSETDEANLIIPEIARKLSSDKNGLEEATPSKTEPNVYREETVLINERSLSEKMCTKFVEIINAYGVMEIINKKPVVFYREDSTKLNLSHNMITDQIVNPNREKCGDMALYANIVLFRNKLRLKAMSINANLNRFDYDEESAFINWEDDFTNEKIKSNLPEIPTITEVLNMTLEESDDYEDEDCCDESDIDQETVLYLLEKVTTGWGDFRNEMNMLYNEIKTSCGIAPTSN